MATIQERLTALEAAIAQHGGAAVNYFPKAEADGACEPVDVDLKKLANETSIVINHSTDAIVMNWPTHRPPSEGLKKLLPLIETIACQDRIIAEVAAGYAAVDKLRRSHARRDRWATAD